jgi:deoxyadenosine/deoxycytidine kinase
MVSLAPLETSNHAEMRRIEILGVFGSGKTTLARKLVASPECFLAEQHERNPFWGADHANKVLGYLAYDLSFLLQHVSLVANITNNEIHICDWSFVSDYIWAKMRQEKEFSAYEAVYDSIKKTLPEPLGYLYIKQPRSIILERLGIRDRAPEKDFVEYVDAAIKELDGFVCSFSPGQILEVTDDTSPIEINIWLEMRTAKSNE